MIGYSLEELPPSGPEDPECERFLRAVGVFLLENSAPLTLSCLQPGTTLLFHRMRMVQCVGYDREGVLYRLDLFTPQGGQCSISEAEGASFNVKLVPNIADKERVSGRDWGYTHKNVFKMGCGCLRLLGCLTSSLVQVLHARAREVAQWLPPCLVSLVYNFMTDLTDLESPDPLCLDSRCDKCHHR
jgi:hypothetical protein